MNKPEWVDTPGLHHLLTRAVPEVAEILKNDERYEPILLVGPTGTGKSYLRDRILEASGLKEKDKQADTNVVVELNCAAIPENLIESALFGYMRGTFTDAKQDKKGLVDCGAKVLVLDEIGTLPQWIQAKLLTYLDTGKYLRVGNTRNEKSETKILAITNAELNGEEAKTTFRKDFLYRFRPIYVPGIHARRYDIPFLLQHLAPEVPWTKSDLLRLMAYHWPGNIREFRRFAAHANISRDSLNLQFMHGPNAALRRLQQMDELLRGSTCMPLDVWGPNYKGLLDLRRLLSRQDRTLINDIENFLRSLSTGSDSDRRIGLPVSPQQREMSKREDEWERPDELDKAAPEDSKIINSAYSWKADWTCFCNLFRQDPEHNGDIIDLILRRKFTDPKRTLHEHYDDWKANESFDNLTRRIDKIFWPAALQTEQGSGEKADIIDAEAGGLESGPEACLLKSFETLAETWTPAQFKEKWIQRCVRLGMGAAEISKKYGIARSSARSMLVRHKPKNRDSSDASES